MVKIIHSCDFRKYRMGYINIALNSVQNEYKKELMTICSK